LQEYLVEESSQGNFVPEGRQDILVEAIGRPTHCGHVRATGKRVGIKLYFGATPRHSSSSPQEAKTEMASKIRQELGEKEGCSNAIRVVTRVSIATSLC